jgi:hypothetical protein
MLAKFKPRIKCYWTQGRHQGRCQPAPGHSLGSLKNKGHTVKNKKKI